MKTPLLSSFAAIAALGLSAVPLSASPQVMNLRYEWSSTLNGPWTPVPEESLKVHADGSATAVSEADLMFFRLNIGDSPAGGSTVPVMPLSALPEPLVLYLKSFIAATGDDTTGDEGDDWKDAELAPFATPVTSPWSKDGRPDMAEVKVIGPCPAPQPGRVFSDSEGQPPEPVRGFILVSLTREDFPVLSFATRGATPAEALLARCHGQPVARLMRFGPTFMVAEDRDGKPLANQGLQPVLLTDESYEEGSRAVSWDWSSESETNPRVPVLATPAEPVLYSSYADLKSRFTGSGWRRQRRTQRAVFAEFDWLAMEGRAPALTLKVGDEVRFLEETVFTSWHLDNEDLRDSPVTITLPPAGGVVVGGLVAGAYRLTLTASGLAQNYMVVVRPGAQPRGGATGEFVTKYFWAAGSWATQPKYDQRVDLHRWCDAVGCGPAALAILITWMEHYQNVPSAYFDQRPGLSAAARLPSARVVDSPLSYQQGEGSHLTMRPWYDWLHDLCDVHCFAGTDAGATYPHDMGEALEEYVAKVTSSSFPTQMGSPGSKLVGANAHWEVDVISDDWDESGVQLAEGIKAGRPGIAFYYELMHYVVAYGYKRVDHVKKVSGDVVSSYKTRAFKCNMGWGGGNSASGAVQFLNAYDIDGCYLLDLWQKRFP